MFKSIHHFSLSVSDFETSIRFYQDLGFESEAVRYEVKNDYYRKVIGYPNGVAHNALLVAPDKSIRLEIIQYVEPKGIVLDLATPNVGSAHICFIVEDIFSVYDRLISKGTRFKSAPVLLDAGPNPGGYAVYFLDPDSYTMELLQLPK